MSLPRRLVIDLRGDLAGLTQYGDDCYGYGSQLPLEREQREALLEGTATSARAGTSAQAVTSSALRLPRPGLAPDDLLHHAHRPALAAAPFSYDLASAETETAELLGEIHVGS
ncbi:MAG: hypothetical protein ACTHK1_06535 [Actinomycetales bacterium]